MLPATPWVRPEIVMFKRRKQMAPHAVKAFFVTDSNNVLMAPAYRESLHVEGGLAVGRPTKVALLAAALLIVMMDLSAR